MQEKTFLLSFKGDRTELLDKLKEITAKKGMTIREYIIQLIEKDLKKKV